MPEMQEQFPAKAERFRPRRDVLVLFRGSLDLVPQTPPEILFHGTATRFYTSILQTGLSNQGRQHVHLSSDPETAYAVGRRHGKPLIFKVLSLDMHKAGHCFYRSRNGVWLTANVPPQYLQKENLTS